VTVYASLRFSAYAWAKLEYWRKEAKTEVGCFGISLRTSPLVVADVQIVKQVCSAAYNEFCDEAVADYFDEMVEAGYHPSEFGRIWLHTHPGSSSKPSSKDWETFERCFGNTDWAIMCIFAEGSQYAFLRTEKPFELSLELPVLCDLSLPFSGSDSDLWKAELDANVQARQNVLSFKKTATTNKDTVIATESELGALREVFTDLFELTDTKADQPVTRQSGGVYVPQQFDIVFSDGHGQCVVNSVHPSGDCVDLLDSIDQKWRDIPVADLTLLERITA